MWLRDFDMMPAVEKRASERERDERREREMMEQNNDSRPTINGALAFRTDSDADFFFE